MVGRIWRSGKEGWEDKEKWKGRVGGFREVERKVGRRLKSGKEGSEALEK